MITGPDLRRARVEKGIGLGKLAAMIGRTKGHLSKVERGVDERAVTPALIRDYERALNVTVLATRDSDRATAPVSTIGAVLPDTEYVSSQALPGPPTVSVDGAAQRAASFAAWVETTNVGPMNLQRFETETRRLARDYLVQSPVPVFAQAVSLARSAFDLIQGGHQHLSQTRDLYLAAGRLSALLSWISGDLGQPVAAAEHARTAWVCADQADDPTLRAWAMSVASKSAFWDGDYLSAAESASHGQRYAAKGTALVMLACQEADALQALGRVKDAETAIARARGFRECIQTSDDVGGLFSCGEARQANYEVSVHLAAREPRKAIAMAAGADEAFASGDQWAYGTWAQIRFGWALAHVIMNDIGGAVEALDPVFDMPSDRHLDTLVRRAGEVVKTLTSPRLAASSETRDLISRAETYRNSRITVRQITQ